LRGRRQGDGLPRVAKVDVNVGGNCSGSGTT
jgi:hypothetical protein